MALEIKELEIRMRVGGDDEGAPARKSASAPAAEGCGAPDQKQLVDESVRRVLQALRNMEER